jgi:hypothetical protein
MANGIQLDAATKKAIVIGIVALGVCVVGAILIVGRGSGSTGLDAARFGPRQGNAPGWYGGRAGTGHGGFGSGRFGQGGSGSGTPAVPATPGTRDDAAFEQFRTCLANHGVTLPGPGEGRPSAPSSDLRSAFEACRRYLPAGPFGGNGFRRGDHDGSGPGDDAPRSGSDSDRSGTSTF